MSHTNPEQRTLLDDLEDVLCGHASENQRTTVADALSRPGGEFASLIDSVVMWDGPPQSSLAPAMPSLGGKRSKSSAGSLRGGVFHWAQRLGWVAALALGVVGITLALNTAGTVRASNVARLESNRLRIQAACDAIDNEDYAVGEQILIDIRSSLDEMTGLSGDSVARRDLLIARASAMEAVIQAARKSRESARRSLQIAESALHRMGSFDSAKGEGAVTLAFVNYAKGKVEFHEAMRAESLAKSRWEVLSESQQSYRNALKNLSDVPSDVEETELLRIRAICGLALAVHKSARSAQASPAVRHEALELYQVAETSLHQIRARIRPSIWDRLYARVKERKGMTLTALSQHPAAIREYTEGIELLQASQDTGELGAYFQIGILYGNMADTLADLNSIDDEILARGDALRNLRRFSWERSTASAAENISLNLGRRAIAWFKRGNRFAAAEDAMGLAAMVDLMNPNYRHDQLAQVEVAKSLLIVAYHRSSSGVEFETVLSLAHDRIERSIVEDGRQRKELQIEMSHFMDIRDFDGSPEYTRIKSLLSPDLDGARKSN